MDAGPDGVEGVVRQLLRTAPAAAATAAGEPAGPSGEILPGPAQPAPHRLPPMGCRGAPAPALGLGCAVGGAHGGADGRSGVPRAVDGIHWAAGGGIGLGAHAAGAPETAWRHVGAVLNLGALQHPG